MRHLIAILVAALAATAQALDPASLTITNYRGEAEGWASGIVLYRGDAVAFTNCILYAGSDSNSVRQDLTGLTLTVTHGDGYDAGIVTTGAVNIATSGVWSASATIATNEALRSGVTSIQIRITDGTNSYTYPVKTIGVRPKL